LPPGFTAIGDDDEINEFFIWRDAFNGCVQLTPAFVNTYSPRFPHAF